MRTNRELSNSTMQGLSQRIELPLIPSKDGPKVACPNDNIKELFAVEDSEKYGRQW
ncbi:MAG: hypothetical protein ACREP9_07780 [Candidatus Dormibacteraceae bacterium]